MNVNKKVLKVIFLSVLLMPVFVFGATIKGEESLLIDSSVLIDGNFYAGGADVSITANTPKDSYIGGGTVSISGGTGEDLTVAGGTIFSIGNVTGDFRAIGGNIMVSSEVGGEMFIAGGNISVTSESIIKNNVDIYGGNINYSGNTLKDLFITGEKVYLNGNIKGNVKINSKELSLGPKTLIEGNLNYFSKEEINFADGAMVKGETILDEVKAEEVEDDNATFCFISCSVLLELLSMILIVLVLFYAFSSQTKKVIEIAKSDFWKQALRGFTILVVVPIFAIICFITMIGWLFGLISLLLYLILIMLALFVSPIVFARVVLDVIKKKDWEISWWIIILSILVLGLVSLIPIIGWILPFILILSSLGSVSVFFSEKLR